jgi:hypothetical protein
MTNLPVSGDFNVTATYGQKGHHWSDGHKGVDITAPDKTIYATCNGTVRVIGYDLNGWGRYVTIGDESGNIHIFCHLERNSVLLKQGDKVTRSTVIGVMGTTGNSSGVHLHYQINNKNGNPINPCPHLGIPNKVGKYNSNNYEVTTLYKDDKNIANWAKKDVYEARDKGYLVGDKDGNFRPKAPLTREEAAALIMRLERALK